MLIPVYVAYFRGPDGCFKFAIREHLSECFDRLEENFEEIGQSDLLPLLESFKERVRAKLDFDNPQELDIFKEKIWVKVEKQETEKILAE